MKENSLTEQDRSLVQVPPKEILRDLAAVFAEKEPESVVGFRTFLKFLRENVTPAELLNNRLAQANLSVILSTYHWDKEIGNPYPRAEIETPKYELRDSRGKHIGWAGPSAHYAYETFMLKGDNENLYFIDDGWPADRVPSYLRTQDIIVADEYGFDKYPKHKIVITHPFNKSIERVPLSGGNAQRYNYNIQQWETSYGNSRLIDPSELLIAETILNQEESTLLNHAKSVIKGRERVKWFEEKIYEREERKNTFSFKLNGEEVTFRTFRDIRPTANSLLPNYLEFLSHNSNLLNIRPDIKTQLKSFVVKEPKGYSAFPFEESQKDIIEVAEEKNDIPAYFLGAFNHPRIVNMTFRLIAIPRNKMPRDAAFRIGEKIESRSGFVDNHMNDMTVAMLTVTDESVRPDGFQDSEYVVFTAQDLIDPIIGKDDRKETVRVVGLSRNKKSLFYRDVDVSEIPVKFMRLAKKSQTNRLPPAPKLLQGE